MTRFEGVWLIHIEPIYDSRGFFARTFSAAEFHVRGLEVDFPQHSVSLSSRKGTIRGMHFQSEPYSEIKLVRCLNGAIWDVIIDLRPQSSTFGDWQGFELSAGNPLQLYIPKGFAHGFQTLSDDVQVNYLISEPYAPDAAMGIRHDDPSLAIDWPLAVTTISEKDLLWPNFADQFVRDLSPR